jgi:hypothetical protein
VARKRSNIPAPRLLPSVEADDESSSDRTLFIGGSAQV